MRLSISGLSGDRLASIPEWSDSATPGYSCPLRSGWNGRIGSDLRFVDYRLRNTGTGLTEGVASAPLQPRSIGVGFRRTATNEFDLARIGP